jgi:hypothetical protein
MHKFRFEVLDTVLIDCSGESGKVIGRAEFAAGEDQYFIRYKDANGIARELWWGDSALSQI